jgi:HAD superfamily hydrolase (TIGR01509 family)
MKIYFPISKRRGILFDMDGVIINSEPVAELSLLELSSHFGRRFSSEGELQRFKGFTERSIAQLLQELFPNITVSIDEIIGMRLDLVRRHFHVVQLIEGAFEFIQRCKAAGYSLGLTTSATRSIQCLAFEKFDLSGYFDAVITGDDVKKGKPDPEPYELAAAQLHLRASDCIVIEDSVNGILSGKAAGCFVIGITTSFSADALEKAQPDLVVPAFGVLASLLFGTQHSSRA